MSVNISPGAIVRTVFGVLAVIAMIIGAAGPQFKSNSKIVDDAVKYFLFKVTVGNKEFQFKDLDDKSSIVKSITICQAELDRWKAASAMALISIIALAVGTLFGVIAICVQRCLKLMSAIGVFLGTAAGIICFAIVESNRRSKLCDRNKSYADWNFKIAYGEVLVIVGWVLGLVALVAGAVA